MCYFVFAFYVVFFSSAHLLFDACRHMVISVNVLNLKIKISFPFNFSYPSHQPSPLILPPPFPWAIPWPAFLSRPVSRLPSPTILIWMLSRRFSFSPRSQLRLGLNNGMNSVSPYHSTPCNTIQHHTTPYNTRTTPNHTEPHRYQTTPTTN